MLWGARARSHVGICRRNPQRLLRGDGLMLRAGRGTSVGLLALLAGPVALGAQQPPPSDSTPRDTLRPYAFPPVVVTASRVPASQPEVGFPISLLDRRDLPAEPTPYPPPPLTVLPAAP